MTLLRSPTIVKGIAKDVVYSVPCALPHIIFRFLMSLLMEGRAIMYLKYCLPAFSRPTVALMKYK